MSFKRITVRFLDTIEQSLVSTNSDKHTLEIAIAVARYCFLYCSSVRLLKLVFYISQIDLVKLKKKVNGDAEKYEFDMATYVTALWCMWEKYKNANDAYLTSSNYDSDKLLLIGSCSNHSILNSLCVEHFLVLDEIYC